MGRIGAIPEHLLIMVRFKDCQVRVSDRFEEMGASLTRISDHRNAESGDFDEVSTWFGRIVRGRNGMDRGHIDLK